VWHFVKLCGSSWQIAVNTVVNTQVTENQLCCPKCLLCHSLSVSTSRRMRSLSWQIKLVSTQLL